MRTNKLFIVIVLVLVCTIQFGYGQLKGINGTPNYIAKYLFSDSLVISPIFDLNGKIGIGTTNPGAKLDVAVGGGAGGYRISANTSNYIERVLPNCSKERFEYL